MKIKSLLITLASCQLLFSGLTQQADAQTIRPKIATRIFWQDRDSDKLSYADLVITDKWSMNRGWIEGFPKLNTEKQDLVQMRHTDGVLLVGVRDNDDGKHQSGWVAIETGVFEEPHGNHSHWEYIRKPRVTQTKLDADQGNPAHVYVYDRQFYLANDTKNGFTRVVPSAVMKAAPDSSTFYSGGGNHITLAAVNNSIAYSSWIDGGGPNVGRVDVVNLLDVSPKIKYSFNLPTGVIHGATHNSGKVFFAPADGVCWVQADMNLKQSPQSVKINYIALGTDSESDKPLRTGAFENQRNWVLFATGTADQSSLCMINAASTEPKVVKLAIPVDDGLKLLTPSTVLSLGKRYAFLFQDRTDADSDIQEKLTIVELDPNRDRDFSDARIASTIDVGASRIEGHHGHHAMSFDAYGRYAVFSEPGEGMINVMDLDKMSVCARFRVGGTPDSLTAVGAPEFHH